MQFSGTPCSFSTLTAWMFNPSVSNLHYDKNKEFTCTTVFPVDIIGYISKTCLRAMSSGNRAYTTLATDVSASDSTKIFPIRIERQQSLKPCSIASPERTIDTPQLPDRYLRPSNHHNGEIIERNCCERKFIPKNTVNCSCRRLHFADWVRQLVQTFFND